MSQYLQNKKGLVQNAFNKVYDKYDLMNDFMSIGIHRLWKKDMINWMAPLPKKKLIDMACGTGDLGKLFLENTNYAGKVLFVDPNSKMLKKGIERLKKHKNISWKKGGAEKIPTPDNNFDYYCISFGLRNTKNINKSLKEAYRVLKPGGRFLCLEFSKIQNIYFNNLYKKYSKLIPHIGKIVVGEKEPYDYLIESIENFINQDELIELMQKNYFIKCEYRNLSGGMVAIHSGWKI
jgi:demethylmenaquinone methyltransferase/2-methoxy-6-polyprenyl-1,4-benzoquinol methylase